MVNGFPVRLWGARLPHSLFGKDLQKASMLLDIPSLRMLQKEVGKRSSITFFVFGTLSVTFWSLFGHFF